MSGAGRAASSGSVVIGTSDAGTEGISGHLYGLTGTSSAGDSAFISLSSSAAVGGAAGAIELLVGTSDTGVGGNVDVLGGVTSAESAFGGKVNLQAGDGGNSKGGGGGAVTIIGGSGIGSMACSGNYLCYGDVSL
jgi:hypothetical protein